jgi:uncharacterized membrane protein YgdD (TMEM256/DUF423 family)
VFALRALTLVLVVPGLVVIALGAFNLQGYQNDPQSAVFQTWHLGVTSLALAASLAWMALGPSENSLQRVVVAAAFVAFVISWVAILS